MKQKYQNDEDFRNKRGNEVKDRYKLNCDEHQQLLQFKEKVMELIGEKGCEKNVTIA
jgi:hypothetical protein